MGKTEYHFLVFFLSFKKLYIYIYIYFFFLLLKDHYFMFLASLVQDYYPDIFLIMILNVDIGLKTAVFSSHVLKYCLFFIYVGININIF